MKMNYEALSLVELKKLAKERGSVKKYYMKSKAELIEILSSEVSLEERVEKMNVASLRREAKDRGLKRFWKLKRNELVRLLYPELEVNLIIECRHV